MEIKSTHISARGITQELTNRRTRALNAQAGAPRIGIFWFRKVDGRIALYGDIPVTIDEGEEFEGFISPKEQHYIVWDQLKRLRNVPVDSTFEYLPRGRVLYHIASKHFLVVLGGWSDSRCESIIRSGFNLPEEITHFDFDPHYEEFVTWILPDA